MTLRKPLKITFELVGPAETQRPFLDLKREKYKIHYEGAAKFGLPNSESEEMIVDYIAREKRPDAVVIIAHKQGSVYLRSCVRPASVIRHLKDPSNFDCEGIFWELPAGLIDPGETPAEAGVRELREEIGFTIPVENLKLVQTTMGLPGLFAERLFFYEVEIPADCPCEEPSLDGSALEKCGEVIAVTVPTLMEELKNNNIPDMKTNLGIRILSDLLK